MSEAKGRVASAIGRAQAELDQALAELELTPAFDATSVAFAAHALHNYLTVSARAVELLFVELAAHPNAQVRVWLEGLQHATQLMARTVAQLISSSVTAEVKLRFEKVDLPILIQRACDYYQRVSDRKSIRLTADSTTNVPLVWTDRVAVAAALDNLLSNAVKYSEPNKQVWVQARGEKGWAVCSVRDEGPGLSPEDQAQLFQKGVPLTPNPRETRPAPGMDSRWQEN